jgi:hypothetical protein
MTEPRATIAGMATKSGGHCIRSEISITQGAIALGKNAGAKAAHERVEHVREVDRPCGGTVRPDVISSVLPPFIVGNVAITGLNPLNFSGRDAGFIVTCVGAW